MRGLDPSREREFFELFTAYFDLERSDARHRHPGEYTLDRMLPLADAVGNPQRRLRVIHVAGTKGKGSTCHFIASLAVSAGCRCGLFASPHLATVRERFQLDGNLVGYDRLLDHARRFEAQLRHFRLHPSLFEIMTVLALDLFADAGCEIAILETGIGGRLDATNFIRHPICGAITPVSFDHTQLLGDTIEAIAREKAGIIKPGVPVVLGRQPFAVAEEVVRERAAALKAPLHRPVSSAVAAPFLRDPDMAPFLQENLALALAVVQTVGLEPDPRTFVLPTVRARCEVIREHPLVVLDAAHNADSARRLVEALVRRWPDTRWTSVLGVVQGKDTAGIVRELGRLDTRFVLTHPRSPRASDLERLRQCVAAAGQEAMVVEDVRDRAQLPADRPILFTGSFFTALIGEELFG